MAKKKYSVLRNEYQRSSDMNRDLIKTDRTLIDLTVNDATARRRAPRLFGLALSKSGVSVCEETAGFIEKLKSDAASGKIDLARDYSKFIALSTIAMLPTVFAHGSHCGVYSASALYGLVYGSELPWTAFDKISRELLARDIAAVVFTLDRHDLRPATRYGHYVKIKHFLTDGNAADSVIVFKVKARLAKREEAVPAQEPAPDMQVAAEIEHELSERALLDAQDAQEAAQG